RIRVVQVVPDRHELNLMELVLAELERGLRELLLAVLPERLSQDVAAKGDAEVLGDASSEDVARCLPAPPEAHAATSEPLRQPERAEHRAVERDDVGDRAAGDA